MTPTIFFQLPTDLQFIVLQDFIGSLDNDHPMLSALSTMDIACCSKQYRDHFLSLASRLTFGTGLTLRSHHDLDYLLWLQSRHIQVRILHCMELPHLADDSKIAFSVWLHSLCNIMGVPDPNKPMWSVQQITFHSQLPNTTTFHFLHEYLFKLFPNVISMEIRGSAGLLVWFPKWPLKTFKALQGVAIADDMPLVLAAFGHSLKEFRMRRVKVDEAMANVIMQTCGQLETLEVRLSTTSHVATITSIVNTLPNLTDLTLQMFEGSIAQVDSILIAGRQKKLKRFSICEQSDRGDSHPLALTDELFAHLLEHHAWLDWLKVGECECSYDRLSNILSVNTDQMNNDALDKILALCPPFYKFSLGVYRSGFTSSQLLRIIDRCRSCLKGLSVFTAFPTEAQLVLIPVSCALLERLLIIQPLILSDGGLEIIARACKRLKFVYLGDSFGSSKQLTITDEGMEALFEGCQFLEEFASDGNMSKISFRTLMASLGAKCLQKLHFSEVGFSKDDVQKYKQLAWGQGRIPVSLGRHGK